MPYSFSIFDASLFILPTFYLLFFFDLILFASFPLFLLLLWPLAGLSPSCPSFYQLSNFKTALLRCNWHIRNCISLYSFISFDMYTLVTGCVHCISSSLNIWWNLPVKLFGHRVYLLEIYYSFLFFNKLSAVQVNNFFLSDLKFFSRNLSIWSRL